MAESVTIIQPDNAVKLFEFLGKKYIKKDEINEEKTITNTRIGGGKDSGISGGSYYIPENEYSNFMKKIYRDVIMKNGKEYLTEAQLPTGGPIAVDIDLRFTYETANRLYTKDHIEDLMNCYLKELQKIYQFDENTNIPIYILEKTTVNRLDDKQITKDGIHIIIGLQADRAVQIYLRKQILAQIPEIWTDLPIINSWEEVLDEGISIGCTNWQLIGCRKPNHEPYELKYVYNISVDSTDNEIMINSVSPSTVLNSENIMKLSVRYKMHQSLFMKSSFIPIYETMSNTTVLKRKASKLTINNTTTNLCQDICSIQNAEQLQLAVNYFLESLQPTQHELREAHNYTMTLPKSYYGPGSFANWIRVGWALRNISDSLFIVWLAFSAQTPDFVYTTIRDELWAKWLTFDTNRSDGLTKRSIMHWSKKDAFTEYQKVRYASVDYFIDQTINSIIIDNVNERAKGKGSYDIARVLYQLFKDEYVCVSVKSSIWYRYKNHRWSEIDSGTTLRRAISDELRDLYTGKALRLMDDKNLLEPDDEKMKPLMVKTNTILDICTRLGNTPDKQNIMTEARELFYDGSFLKKLDMNPYLMCFSNGVIDFKEKRFRNGYPEDNLSKCTNIDYIPLNPEIHGKQMVDIKDFMQKLFPIAELNQYMWDHLASTMTGLTTNQTFNMYIGVGSNGKSVLVNLMEKVLGDYKGDVPLSLITQPRTKIGSASPEIAALRGVRFAVMQEPSKGDKIIEGQLKALTGGDPLTGRALYMDNITFIPQFKLVVCTNEFMDVKSNDHGTWRRICVVDYMSLFTETPVSNDPDKPYQYKLDKYINEKFATWAPIFASMLVERVYETGGNVNIPEMVKSASNAYREQQDYIAEFVRDRISKSATDCIQKNVLANVFKEWYNTNYGNRVPNMKEITTYMDKQFGKQRNGVWSGVKIVFDSEFSRVPSVQTTMSGSTSGEDDDMEDIDINDL